MNSSTYTITPSSLRYAVVCVAASVAMLTLGACNKSPDAAASKDGAATDTPTAQPAAADAKKPKATLKTADVKSAYAAEFNNNAKMTDPLEKKVAAFVAKVGKAESDTGRKMTWYSIDGSQCTKIELDTKDGSMMDMTATPADCGM